MARYDILLLDADGTLFDFKAAQRQSLMKLLESCALPFTQQTLESYDRINEGQWRRFERGEIEKTELLASRFRIFFREWGREISGAQSRAYNEQYLDALSEGAQLLDGALELCKALYGRCRLCIATNGVSKVQRRRLSLSALAPYISELFVSEDIGYPKPDTRYYQAVFRALHEPDRRRVLMVGDSLTSDMAGGRRAGIDTCWFCPHPGGGRSPSGELPADVDYMVRELPQLLAIVD